MVLLAGGLRYSPFPITSRGKHIPIKIIENPFTLDLVLIVHP